MSATRSASTLSEAQASLPELGTSKQISIEQFIKMEERVAAQTLTEVLTTLRTVEPNDDDIVTACSRVGREGAPALIRNLWRDVAWRPWIVRVVGSVWSMAERPESLVPQERWITMFRAAGFRDNGDIAAPPAEAVDVYRGSTHAGRFGMSWTTDLNMARAFARGGLRGRPAGSVWTARVPPEFVLARIGGDSAREEGEVVVDPAGLSEVLEFEPRVPQKAEEKDATNGECIMCPQPAVVTTAAPDLRYGIDYSPLCAECLDEPWT